MYPRIIKGGFHTDERGEIRFNNEFNASDIKRIYIIENKEINFVRGWQGHKIERRWFATIQGCFEIKLICIDDWNSPNPFLEPHTFLLDEKCLDILFIPNGYISSIQGRKDNSKLLAMSDHIMGEVEDEYRFEKNYFNTI